MTDSNTLISIVEVISETLPGIEIDLATDVDRAFRELGVDSLDKMSLLLAIQDKWNLEFTETEISELNTINDILRRVS